MKVTPGMPIVLRIYIYMSYTTPENKRRYCTYPRRFRRRQIFFFTRNHTVRLVLK